MTDTTGKLRALVLATLMVLSTFGGLVAVSGTAAANASTVGNAQVSNVEIGQAAANQQVSVDVTDDGSGDTLSIDVPDGVDVVGATVASSAFPNTSASVNDNLVNVSYDGTGSQATGTIAVTITHDTSAVGEPTSGVTLPIDAVNGSASASPTFALVDTTAPVNASVDSPSGSVLAEPGDTVQVGYSYEDADPGATTILLGGTPLTTVDDTGYAGDGSTRTVTVALDGVPDGTYQLNTSHLDGSGNNVSATGPSVTVDGTAPSNVTATEPTGTTKLPSDGTVNVTYSYSEANPDRVAITLQSDAGSATFVFDDSGYAGDDTTVTRELNLSNPDSTTGSGIADGYRYTVTVDAVDAVGNAAGAQAPGEVVIDDQPPSVELIDVEPGERTAIVYFSEPVGATDPDGPGALDATDFTYTDGNGANASAIESVEFEFPSRFAELTLDAPVSLGDLENDAIGIREGVVADRAGSPNAAQELPLTDVTSPQTPVVDATGGGFDSDAGGLFLPVDADNAGSYPVKLVVPEPESGGTVSVTVEGPNGTTASNSTTVAASQSVYVLTVDATALDDGTASVTAGYAEPSGATAESPFPITVRKDTAAPTVASAETNAGVSELSVTFSESVFGVSANTLSVSGADVNVTSVEHAGGSTFEVDLDGRVDAADLGSASIAVQGVTDSVGNPATGSATFGTATATVDAESGSGTVTVRASFADPPSGNITVAYERKNAVVTSTTQLTFQDGVSGQLNLTEVSPGIYEATFNAPHDGEYDVRVVKVNQSGTFGLDIESPEADTGDPAVVDAAILGVNSAGQFDDRRATTRIRVRYSEPVDASAVDPADVSIEGFDGEVIEVVPQGTFGVMDVYVDGYVQTGDSPQVSVAGVRERSGDGTMAAGGTTLHTTKLVLDEGRNFVSVPAASGDLPLSQLDLSAVDVIYAYDAANETFESYVPGAQENDFSALEGGRGYIVTTSSATTLDVNVYNVPGQTGSGAVAPNTVELSEGFNLVGQFQEDDQPVMTAFGSLEEGAVFKVYAQGDGSRAYQSFNSGDFEDLETGEAYWVFVKDDEVYTETPFGYSQALDLFDEGN